MIDALLALLDWKDRRRARRRVSLMVESARRSLREESCSAMVARIYRTR